MSGNNKLFFKFERHLSEPGYKDMMLFALKAMPSKTDKFDLVVTGSKWKHSYSVKDLTYDKLKEVLDRFDTINK